MRTDTMVHNPEMALSLTAIRTVYFRLGCADSPVALDSIRGFAFGSEADRPILEGFMQRAIRSNWQSAGRVLTK